MLHQIRSESKIFKRFEMEDCNSTSAPAEQRLQLSKNSVEDNVDPTQYGRFIGSLRYLCHTMSDLAYCVGMLSRFIMKSKVSHLTTMKMTLRYLNINLDYGIMFPASDEGKRMQVSGLHRLRLMQ